MNGNKDKEDGMSQTRRDYFGRLIGRIGILLLCAYVWIYKKESFAILEGWAFFKQFSVFHFLWVLWVVDMFLQIIPVRNKVPWDRRNCSETASVPSWKRSTTMPCAIM